MEVLLTEFDPQPEKDQQAGRDRQVVPSGASVDELGDAGDDPPGYG
ncbi:hypothetical protein [Streptomyces sp. NRRL F-2580]|nr:hypothetical protein [Streptomyces sp. NRRL F-2580]